MGGVIIGLDMNASIKAFKKIGLNNVEKLLDSYAQSGIFAQLENGDINIETFHDGIRSMINKNVTNEQIDDALKAFLLDIPPERLKMLLRLRKQFKVLLLSNTNPIHFPWVTEKIFGRDGHQLSDFFDHCYLSYEMHLSKPGKKIFQALLKDADVKPSECFYIDDGPQNIETAKKIGFHTYLLKPNEDVTSLFSSILK